MMFPSPPLPSPPLPSPPLPQSKFEMLGRVPPKDLILSRAALFICLHETTVLCLLFRVYYSIRDSIGWTHHGGTSTRTVSFLRFATLCNSILLIMGDDEQQSHDNLGDEQPSFRHSK